MPSIHIKPNGSEALLISFLILLCASCGDNAPLSMVDNGTAQVWTTNNQGTILLSPSSNLLAFEDGQTGGITIDIDTTTFLQTMDGFGAALSGSSAFVLKEHLSDVDRTNLLNELFLPDDGIGISFIRLTIGASDFSTADYTYNDLPGGGADPDQSAFSLDRDQEHLISVLQEIVAIRPDIKIMGTPWSAPAWMKTTGELRNGGRLREDLYSSYATYLISYIEDMAAEGIPIYAISVQNEPLLGSGYPTMEMSSGEQKIFIRDHLGPALVAAGLSTQVIIYDHNWDNVEYALDILNDSAAKGFVAGTAFHCYAGDVSAMSQVHTAHPDRGIYFTECSGGDFSPDFGSNLSWNADNLLVGATRNWAKNIIFWNLALNEMAGPQNGGCSDCRGVITVNANNGNVDRNVEYYLLGHIAKFVQPGASRLLTPSLRGQGLSQVAFMNPDRSRTLLVFNHNDQRATVSVGEGGGTFRHIIEAGSLVTFTW